MLESGRSMGTFGHEASAGARRGSSTLATSSLRTIRSRYASAYILVLYAIALSACQDPITKTNVITGYCEQYRRLVVQPADATELQKLPRSLKERLVANESTYRCACTDYKGAVCNVADKK